MGQNKLKNCGNGRLLEYEVYPTYIQTSRISAELEPRRRPELEWREIFLSVRRKFVASVDSAAAGTARKIQI